MTSENIDDIKLASGKSAARNRINQQRYRERQKGKLREYEQQVTTLNQRLTALELENRSLGDRNRLLERLAQLAGNLDEGQSALNTRRRSLTEWGTKETAAAAAGIMNAARRQAQPLITPEEADKLPFESLTDADRVYVQQLSTLLLAGTQPGTAALKELEDYVLQFRQAWMQLLDSLDNPGQMKFISMLTAKPLSPFKESMVSVMNLSPDQKRNILEARRRALKEMEGIKVSRRTIAGDMIKTLEMSEPVLATQSSVDEMVTKMRANDSFKDSLETEIRCQIQFWKACTQSLTPVQEAKAMIEIFPDTDLDVWSLASYLEAEEEGKIERWMAAFASPEGIRHYLYSEIPSGNSASAYRQQGCLRSDNAAAQQPDLQLNSSQAAQVAPESRGQATGMQWEAEEVDELLGLLSALPEVPQG